MSNYPYDSEVEDTEFITDVFELAFGDGAIDKGYSYEDVLGRLRTFSDRALVSEDNGLSQEEIKTLLTEKTGGMFNG
jgi:hypothetical protein|tara:strand:+ start:41 stop:271 length:231 start_codon:yes stop_codon:yes gene_type:complete